MKFQPHPAPMVYGFILRQLAMLPQNGQNNKSIQRLLNRLRGYHLLVGLRLAGMLNKSTEEVEIGVKAYNMLQKRF